MNSIHSFNVIEANIEKMLGIKIEPFGWTSIDIVREEPREMDLNTLITPGNYKLSGGEFLNSPFSENAPSPINVSVAIFNSTGIAQIYTAANFVFYRTSEDKTTFTDWIDMSILGNENVIYSDIKPPLDGNDYTSQTIWVDIANINKGQFTINVFYKDDFRSVKGVNKSLVKNIYDVNNKNTDIFEYIENKTIYRDYAADTAMIDEHIANNIMHTSITEKEEWQTKFTKTHLDNLMDTIIDQITATFDTKYSTLIETSLEAYAAQGAQVIATADAHMDNATIHPSIEKQEEYNTRAPNTHTHMLDDRVTIKPENVVGQIQVYDSDFTDDIYNKLVSDVFRPPSSMPAYILDEYNEKVYLLKDGIPDIINIPHGYKVFDPESGRWYMVMKDDSNNLYLENLTFPRKRISAKDIILGDRYQDYHIDPDTIIPKTDGVPLYIETVVDEYGVRDTITDPINDETKTIIEEIQSKLKTINKYLALRQE